MSSLQNKQNASSDYKCISSDRNICQEGNFEDGLTPDEFFKLNRGTSIAYDDVILLPAHINYPVDAIGLETKITPRISLKTPIISSPMDTVTESDMAIKMALHGGLGIIHCNCSPEKQAQMVAAVKRHNNGFISDPVTLSTSDNVQTVKNLIRKYHFSSFPVTENGKLGSALLGMVTKRDVELVEDPLIPVKKVMTQRKNISVADDKCSLRGAFELVKTRKVNQLPIVDEQDRLMAMICKRDILANMDYPCATKNPITNQLMVGAAVSTHPEDAVRVDRLIQAGVDLLVVDSSNGDSVFQTDTIKRIKERHDIEIMAGNVVTASQAARLIDAGADALRIGQGIGSICTTQSVIGVGRAQATAVHSVTSFIRKAKKEVGTVADGGIKTTGDIVKALALGASCVMVGGLLAGTDEAPGELTFRNGVPLKKYRGMGSAKSAEKLGGAERYLNKGKIFVPQGVSGEVLHKGALGDLLPKIRKGIQHGLQNLGTASLDDFQRGEVVPRLERRTAQAQKEGGIHDMYSYEKTN